MAKYNSAEEYRRADRRRYVAYLSEEAFEIMEQIGKGGRILCKVESGEWVIRNFPPPRNPERFNREPLPVNPLPVSDSAVQELLRRDLISALTRKTANMRIGWEESGMTENDGAEFYMLTM